MNTYSPRRKPGSHIGALKSHPAHIGFVSRGLRRDETPLRGLMARGSTSHELAKPRPIALAGDKQKSRKGKPCPGFSVASRGLRRDETPLRGLMAHAARGKSPERPARKGKRPPAGQAAPPEPPRGVRQNMHAYWCGGKRLD